MAASAVCGSNPQDYISSYKEGYWGKIGAISLILPQFLELYPESVFFGQYRSVFLGIYQTDTEGKLGQYFRYQKFGKKMAGAPFFL
jgi:hypothetical protein